VTASLFTPGLRVSGCTTVRKRRELPLAGVVRVSEGERVQSDQIIAEAEREGELRVVRVAEILGVSPQEACERIVVRLGDSVEQGAVVAKLRGLWGLFTTTAEAPIAGRVEFISEATGHVGIRAPSSTIAVRAYIDGVIERVEPGRGAVVVAQATLVQGIFGVGGERSGVITMLAVRPNQRVTEGEIPTHCAGAIVIGGQSPTIGTLKLAASRGAVGFVTASIDDKTLAEYVGYDIGIALTGDERVPMTVIITEGFGSLAMNERIVSILRRAEGAQASLNGATQVRAGAQRPEIITTVTDVSAADFSTAGSSTAQQSDSNIQQYAAASEQGIGLQVGSRVRVIRVPYFGLQGYVTALPKELVAIETGALARVATVMLDAEQREVVVPRANIELEGVGR
jgi:hypothetical protein